MRKKLLIVSVLALALAGAVPVLSHAATSKPASAAAAAATPSAGAAAATPTPGPSAKKRSKTTTRTYDLDFTLPTAGKSGCTVCHGDENLVRPEGAGTRSLYVDVATLGQSAHKDTPCTGCHIDFAFKVPHKNAQKSDEWRRIAAQACKNCHDAEFTQMNSGAHSAALRPGMTVEDIRAERKAKGKPLDIPLCGDCHGSHEIPASEDASGQAAIHRTGLEMCGGCHKEEADRYADYYHGAAYRRGAGDAPACWDCHTAHEMRPASDPLSPVNKRNLPETCGACHKGLNREPGAMQVADEYIAYSELVHRGPEVQAGVVLLEWWSSARTAVGSAWRTMTGWF